MAMYLGIIKYFQSYFDLFNIQQVPRENNTLADTLAGLGAVLKNVNLTNIPIVYIMKSANEQTDEKSDVLALDTNGNDENGDVNSWIQAYKNYLQYGVQPNNNNEARTLRMKASSFTVIDDVFFKKYVKGHYVHEGECGSHTGGRNLSLKVLYMGYYWPIVKQDAIDFVKICAACQRHRPIIHQPSKHLYALIPSWPFMKWGTDIVGKMPPVPG